VHTVIPTEMSGKPSPPVPLILVTETDGSPSDADTPKGHPQELTQPICYLPTPCDRPDDRPIILPGALENRSTNQSQEGGMSPPLQDPSPEPRVGASCAPPMTCEGLELPVGSRKDLTLPARSPRVGTDPWTETDDSSKLDHPDPDLESKGPDTRIMEVLRPLVLDLHIASRGLISAWVPVLSDLMRHPVPPQVARRILKPQDDPFGLPAQDAVTEQECLSAIELSIGEGDTAQMYADVIYQHTLRLRRAI